MRNVQKLHVRNSFRCVSKGTTLIIIIYLINYLHIVVRRNRVKPLPKYYKRLHLLLTAAFTREEIQNVNKNNCCMSDL